MTSCLALSGCISRGQVRATVWLNNGLPDGICDREPVLWDYGFYRKLKDGKFEFMSFCDPRAKDWVSIYKDDFERILDGLLPKGVRK